MLSVEFVATPDPDAEVRCALHDPEARVYVADGALDLGVADFQGSPGGVGGEDGYRRITATITVVSDEWSARRFQSALARELLRAENYLRVQFTEDTPVVWFHTWRTTPGPMDLQAVDSGIWQFTVQVDADAYSLGEVVQQGVTLTNDPADGLALVLEDAVGDAPAPLLISGIDQGDGTIVSPLVAVTPLTEWSGLQWWKDELTGGTTVADSDAVGGTALKFDTGDVLTASLTTQQAGTYRLFARVRGTSPHVGSLVASGSAALKPSITGTVVSSATFFYVDLGLYTFPRGNVPLAAGYTLAPSADDPEVTITSTVDTGTASQRVDFIMAVPVDLFESAGDSRMIALATNGLLGQRLDGDKERIGPIPAPNPVSPRPADQLVGAFPQITPGAVNVLHFLTKVQADGVEVDDVAEPLGTVAVLNVRYRPRWLYQASA